MLSNPRFNCILSKGSGVLHARLLPRGDQFLPLNSHKTDEMDFVLSECYVSDIKTLVSRVAKKKDLTTNKTTESTVNVGDCVLTYWEEYQSTTALPKVVGATDGVVSAPAVKLSVYKEDRILDVGRGEVVDGLEVELLVDSSGSKYVQ